MLRSPLVSTLAATVLAGFFLGATVLLSSDFAGAEPATDVARSYQRSADLKATLDSNDEVAALEALQVTLSEVGDGSTFVWYRANGKLSGVFQPTTSFRNAQGRICRHLKLMLTSGATSRHTEGIACRAISGVWSLDG